MMRHAIAADPASLHKADTPRRQNIKPLDRWRDAFVVAAGRLNLDVSRESILNEARWSENEDTDEALIDLARNCGLTGRITRTSLHALSSVVLPAIVMIEPQIAGVIIEIMGDQAVVLMAVDGKTVGRAISLEVLEGRSDRRVVLVEASETARTQRVHQNTEPKKTSLISLIFSGSGSTILELSLGSFFSSLLAMATSLFAMQLWDRVVPARSIPSLWVLASGVLLALALEFAIKCARASIADRFGKRADLALSNMVFTRVLDIRSDARPKSPGTLIAQLRDLESIREILTSATLGVLIDLPFSAVFLVIIWLLAGPLVLIPLAAIPILLIPGLLLQIPFSRLAKQGLQEAALRNTILMESIHRIEDIKLLQAEKRFTSVWNQTNRVNGEIGLKQRTISALMSNTAPLIQQLAYIAVLISGVYAILDGTLSFGAVLAASILTSRATAPLGQLSGVLARLQNARTGRKALESLMALPTDHGHQEERYHKPRIRGHYQFDNVVFSYDIEQGPALAIPSMTIKPGEKIAVLGRIGSGKSTLLRIAAGVIEPQQGRVVLDQAPVSMIDVSDLRRDICMLSQEAGLFCGSIRENMLIANPQASDDEILEALQLSGVDQLLSGNPKGLRLMLRENGAGLSGGQRQALMLARVFLRKPSILLLDEPTASFDDSSEAALIERLRDFVAHRTMIVATHRYSLLSLVDRIVVVDSGRIVHDGPRDLVIKALQGGVRLPAHLSDTGSSHPKASAAERRSA